ncbi:hypothetical protein FOL47_010934 [Perkinsus chesapeaki]|uniref:Mei2-like C-terminal RNA recognition motif domain-containing protein n=1 Tax=Perkinsus chesapeaki TaxID=330153 RepID=A0A7J6N1G3_PERCH|nr:hypothetical protein FOL47_010934 [Perkinsus chesapeaki]
MFVTKPNHTLEELDANSDSLISDLFMALLEATGAKQELGATADWSEASSVSQPSLNFQELISEEEVTAPCITPDVSPAAAQKHPVGEDGADEVYTLMLRNIPDYCNTQSLLAEVDALGFAGLYDYCYLPIDINTSQNLGYAFINFINPAGAALFQHLCEGQYLSGYPNWSRPLSIRPALIQGMEKNLMKFAKVAMRRCKDPKFKPVVLENGVPVNLQMKLAEIYTAKGLPIPTTVLEYIALKYHRL